MAGYAVSHDVSERAFQLDLSPQWDLGKSCETFNPLGPWLVTADEVPDPQAVLEPGRPDQTPATRPGVALGLSDHPYLRAGDEVRLEIDGLGWAQQRFIPAP